jgi:hypothetical protein
MTKVSDGGPAFPTSPQISQNNTTGETVVYQYLSDGVSIRDYFAAKAMHALLTNPGIYQSREKFAKDAYEMADAMLAERGK